MTDPFADNADDYLAAGWNPIPLPFKRKDPPPLGFTGNAGTYVPITANVIGGWLTNGCDQAGKRPWNIGLRLPDTVLGIDVDHYDGKTGGDTLATHEATTGALPPTWRSSSRGDDGVSGIRFYRVPAGRRWAGSLAGGSVEIVSHHYRFAVIWPSIHPSTGQPYAWTDPDGFPCTEPPAVDDLPDLPAAWVEVLDLGDFEETRDAKADLHESEAWEWLEREAEPGKPCRAMGRKLDQISADLDADGASHHDVALTGVLALTRLAEQGHAGVLAALSELKDAFAASIGHRPWKDAEWVRMVLGGVAIALASRTPFEDRGCCGDEKEDIVDLGEQATEDYVRGSSWQEVDLESVLDGSYQRPAQTVGTYGDGSLFYPGMVNGVAGESGAGKSWVALVCCAQEIWKQNHVVYVDYEADVGSVVHRLLDIGVDKDHVREFFHYVHPYEKMTEEGKEFFIDGLVVATQPSLVVIDSTGESMAMEGTKPNDDDDVADWFRLVANPIARRGPAVLLLDHTVKSQEGGLWPIGSQRKRAAISTQYILRIDQPYDRDTSGGSNLICAKDRHGNYSFARLVCRLAVSVEDGLDVSLIDVAPATDAGERGLSVLERRILMYVDERMREVHGQLDDEDEIMEGRPTKTKIKSDVQGKDSEIIRAIDSLVDRNLLLPVEVKSGKRRTVTLYEPGVRDFDIVPDED